MKLKVCFIALLVLAPASSWATAVKASFTGSITRMFYATCTSFQDGSCSAWDNSDVASSTFYGGHDLAVGRTFSGVLAYEITTPLSGMPGDGRQAVYLDGVTSYELESGSMHLPVTEMPRAGNGSFSVINDRRGFDSFHVSQWFSGPEFFATSAIDLFDNTGTVYSDFSVPASFDLSNFDTLFYHLSFLRRSDGDQLHVYGDLSNFHASVIGVPEPNTAYIFFEGGMLVLVLAACRRRKDKLVRQTRKVAAV